MAVLILNANSASALTLSVMQTGGETQPIDIGEITPSFLGADRNSIRGQKRQFGTVSSLVDTSTKDSIKAAFSPSRSIACSGDLLGNIQTQCTVKYTGCRIIQGTSPLLWEVSLTLSEVQPNVTLLRYAPGDTITGESFTRGSSAPYCDGNGVYQSLGNNVKRSAHVIPVLGLATLLLEDSRLQSGLWSRDLTNAAWVKTGTGTSAFTAVGLDGTSNSATTLTDSDAAAGTTWQRSLTISNDSNRHAVEFWIKKDSDTTRFPLFQLQLSGGTAVTQATGLNTQTGAIAANNNIGVVTQRVWDAGLWWVVELTATNNTTGNTTLRTTIWAAFGSTIAVVNVATTGSIVVGQAQVELNAPFGSSPVFATSGSVTRSGDSYSLPFTDPPKELTVYAKFVELGTVRTPSAHNFSIGNAAQTAPIFVCYAPAGKYRAHHHNGVAAVTSEAAVAPAFNDIVELCVHLYGDGSVDLIQSINGGAATTSTQSAANTLSTAWSGLLCWLNSGGSGAQGFTAIQSFKIIAGARSLTEMRAL